jgi:hypothetical protein
MPQWILSLFTGGLSALFGVFGKTITDVHADNTTRFKNENDAGNQLATTTADASVKSSQIRADVQKSQGTWGPFGLAGFIIAMMFAYHTSMIVLDSTSWHLLPTLKWYFLPWIEWQPHVVGSWKVATLPGKFEDTEHAILQALFYVGPPSAALVIASKAFRR